VSVRNVSSSPPEWCARCSRDTLRRTGRPYVFTAFPVPTDAAEYEEWQCSEPGCGWTVGRKPDGAGGGCSFG